MIANIVMLIPFILTPILINWRLRVTRGKNRLVIYILAILFFWFMIASATYLSGAVAFRIARSEAERRELAMHDSGPLFASVLFGWLIGIPFVALIAGIHWLRGKRRTA